MFTRGQFAKRDLEFSHDQAVTVIKTSISEKTGAARTSLNTDLERGPIELVQNLARAIKHTDAELAGRLREAGRHSGFVKLLLEKICPLEAGRDKQDYQGSKRLKKVAAALDELRFEMKRLPGLWVVIHNEQTGAWPDLNHQIFPYFSQIGSFASALKEAAHTGEDVTHFLDQLTGLHERAVSNLDRLNAGDVVDRALDDVLAQLPAGQTVSTLSPYWHRNSPEWQRDVYDNAGRANLRAIKHAEGNQIENLQQAIEAIRELAPQGQAAAYTKVLFPPDNASRPSKAWLSDVRQALGSEQINELLDKLAAFDPFNTSTQRFADITAQGAMDLERWDRETSKWQGHDLGGSSGRGPRHSGAP